MTGTTAKTLSREDEVLYSVQDLMKFGFSSYMAYALMHSSGFPTVRINRRLYVKKASYDSWMSRNEGKHYVTGNA